MRRILVPLLVAACAAVALAGVLAVGLVGRVTADAARTPDPDPPGVDTLDRATVERLTRLRLPAEASEVHTRYAEGIDYVLSACFRIPRAALPAFTAGLPAGSTRRPAARPRSRCCPPLRSTSPGRCTGRCRSATPGTAGSWSP